ncbi:hypothetical protein C2G38_2166053 [Gigaspora rosea]|uniref:Uncharacterized protein n=1 Tax=Gigaspora rosea TaxID=44941 RepID=A0A397VS85_9GLOM|nr:hypothetical protein C2G38_2166053 [Gigaspora rosea]
MPGFSGNISARKLQTYTISGPHLVELLEALNNNWVLCDLLHEKNKDVCWLLKARYNYIYDDNDVFNKLIPELIKILITIINNDKNINNFDDSFNITNEAEDMRLDFDNDSEFNKLELLDFDNESEFNKLELLLSNNESESPYLNNEPETLLSDIESNL